MKKTLGGLCLLGLFFAGGRAQTPTLSWESWHPTASARASWVDNISRTSHEPTRKESATYELETAGTLTRQLARNWLAIGSGQLNALWVEKYERANRFDATGGLTLQRKFGLGPQAWVAQAHLSGGYQVSRLRDDRGIAAEAGLKISKRVLPALRLIAGTRWIEHDARSAVFDLDQHAFALEAHWDIADRWTLSADASRLSGNIVANAAPAIWAAARSGGFGQEVQRYYSSRPWSVTHLYGDDWISYNVEADVDLWSATLAYAWTERMSVAVRRSAAFVVNRADITYPSSQWSLTLSHRF